MMIIDNADDADILMQRDERISSQERDLVLKKKILLEYILQSSKGSIISTTKDKYTDICLTGNGPL